MICPLCDKDATRVIYTRQSNKGLTRRRECNECDQRFTTLEVYSKVKKWDGPIMKTTSKNMREMDNAGLLDWSKHYAHPVYEGSLVITE